VACGWAGRFRAGRLTRNRNVMRAFTGDLKALLRLAGVRLASGGFERPHGVAWGIRLRAFGRLGNLDRERLGWNDLSSLIGRRRKGSLDRERLGWNDVSSLIEGWRSRRNRRPHRRRITIEEVLQNSAYR